VEVEKEEGVGRSVVVEGAAEPRLCCLRPRERRPVGVREGRGEAEAADDEVGEGAASDMAGSSVTSLNQIEGDE
jgi:hypothetical protein